MQLGDRVRIKDSYTSEPCLKGDTGTILVLTYGIRRRFRRRLRRYGNDKIHNVGIEWDKFDMGHNLNTNWKKLRPCKQGHGYWVYPRHIELVEWNREITKPCTCSSGDYCPICGSTGYITYTCQDTDNKPPGENWKYVQTR